MKKQITFLAIFIFLFTSCENLISSKKQTKTTISISLPKSRAVYEKEDVCKYTVTVEYRGEEEPAFENITKTAESGETLLIEEVQAGLNLVQILGYNAEDKVIAKGESEVNVIEEQDNAVTVIMHLLSDEEYKGDDLEDETPPAEDPPVVTPKIYISETASGSGDGSIENPFTVIQGLSSVKDGTEVYVLSDLSLDSVMIIANVKIIGDKNGDGEPINVKYGGSTTRILSLASTIVLENIIFDGEELEKSTAPIMVNGDVTFNKCEFRNFNIDGGDTASSKGILYVAGNKKAVLNDCVFENFPSTVSAISIDANGYCELNNSAIIPQEGASAINVESGGQYKIDGVEGTESKSGEILVDYISLIKNAEAGDVIKLLHDFSVEDGLFITNDLTIDGNGKTITRDSSDGEVNGPLFYVMYKQTLKISELTIDCNNIKVVDVSVAGIQNDGTMILVDCRIENILSENIGIMNKANSSYTIKNVIVGNDEIGDESDTSISEEKSF